MKRVLPWLLLATSAHADPPASAPPAETSVLPPWTEPGDIPISAAVKSIRVKVRESALYQHAGATDQRRGTLLRGDTAPVFAAQRGAHCNGRWLLVGPSAWLCSDEIEFMAAPYVTPPPAPSLLYGLPFAYYFVHGETASAYTSLEGAGDAAPEGDLERGFFLPIVEVREKEGSRWGRTRAGQWISMSELAPARPLDFQGVKIEGGTLDVAWVRSTKATVKPDAKGAKPSVLPRFSQLKVGALGKRIAVSNADGTSLGTLDAKDLSVPTVAAPPAEILGAERWIDIDLASQTLVAYEGKTPIFATLVSTGKGPKGSELATPPGTFRIWVKLRTTDMDNLEKDFADDYYSIADVPYVQFFHKGVALHAAFWHRDLGHVHSHGCVNLVPEDARFLFGWTAPHVPPGWDAVLPTAHERGTLVRVR